MDGRFSVHIAVFLLEWLHAAAIVFILAAYAIRISLLLHLPAVKEAVFKGEKTRRAIFFSFAYVLMPWKMEIYRRHPGKFFEFAMLHLAIALAIVLPVILEWKKEIAEITSSASALQLVLYSGAGVGLLRLIRRIVRTELRLISTPDDYFSLCLVTT